MNDLMNPNPTVDVDGYTVFSFNGYPVRAKLTDHKDLWFSAKDICDALEIPWHSRTLDFLKEHHKGVEKFTTPGGKQDHVVVNRNGAWKLAFRSDTEDGETFTDWVVDFVLPSLLGGNQPTAKTKQLPSSAIVPISQVPPSLKLVSAATKEAAAIIKHLPALTDRNQQTFAINRIVKKETGVDVLEMAGLTHLVCEDQRKHYNPTELGKMVNPVLSAIKINQLLNDQGYQLRGVDGGKHTPPWLPTEKANGHFIWTDTGKSHKTEGAAPIQQLRWYDSILGELVLPPVEVKANAS